MRKITADAIEALRMGRNFKRGNTEVKVWNTRVKFTTRSDAVIRRRGLFLHGSLIAEMTQQILYLHTHGCMTALTKERLNGIPSVNIVQKNKVWFLNGEEWDGGHIKLLYSDRFGIGKNFKEEQWEEMPHHLSFTWKEVS